MKIINPFSKKIKLRYRLLTAGGSALLILLIMLTLLLSMVFSTEQNFQMTPISGNDMSTGTKVINRLMNQTLQNKDKKAVKTITLTEGEVNSVITLAANSKNIVDIYLGRPPDIVKRPWQVRYQNGKFNIRFCALTETWTPFGSKINLEIVAVPYITPETERVEILSASAGSIPLPRNKTEELAMQHLDKIRRKKEFKRIRKIIVKTTVNSDRTLTIHYRPYRLRKLISKLLF